MYSINLWFVGPWQLEPFGDGGRFHDLVRLRGEYRSLNISYSPSLRENGSAEIDPY